MNVTQPRLPRQLFRPAGAPTASARRRRAAAGPPAPDTRREPTPARRRAGRPGSDAASPGAPVLPSAGGQPPGGRFRPAASGGLRLPRPGPLRTLALPRRPSRTGERRRPVTAPTRTPRPPTPAGPHGPVPIPPGRPGRRPRRAAAGGRTKPPPGNPHPAPRSGRLTPSERSPATERSSWGPGGTPLHGPGREAAPPPTGAPPPAAAGERPQHRRLPIRTRGPGTRGATRSRLPAPAPRAPPDREWRDPAALPSARGAVGARRSESRHGRAGGRYYWDRGARAAARPDPGTVAPTTPPVPAVEKATGAAPGREGPEPGFRPGRPPRCPGAAGRGWSRSDRRPGAR